MSKLNLVQKPCNLHTVSALILSRRNDRVGLLISLLMVDHTLWSSAHQNQEQLEVVIRLPSANPQLGDIWAVHICFWGRNMCLEERLEERKTEPITLF